MDEMLTFDRTDDVSKLEGCNTRGVEYRWDIFTKRLDTIPSGSHAIDFGLGPSFLCCFRRCHGFADAAPSVIKLVKPRITNAQIR